VEIRVLGAHKLESRDTRHTCFLVDEELAVDAGSLASALTEAEQRRLRAVLLSHRHFDHVRDLPTLGLATLEEPGVIDVYSLPATLEAVRTHLLNWDLYPDFTRPLAPDRPERYHLHDLEPGAPVEVLDGRYAVDPLEVPHPAPSVGFVIRDREGATLAYSGDTGGRLLPFFAAAPQVLLVEVSFPDRLLDLAKLTGHLTPSLLQTELEAARAAGHALPPLVAVHMSPHDRAEIDSELERVAGALDVDLRPGEEELRISLPAGGGAARIG